MFYHHYLIFSFNHRILKVKEQFEALFVSIYKICFAIRWSHKLNFSLYILNYDNVISNGIPMNSICHCSLEIINYDGVQEFITHFKLPDRH